MVWLACLFLLASPSSPTEQEAAPWIGSYRSGPETIAFRWENGLIYDHGNISIPVDGEWHVTVPEFYVRHRVSWLPEVRSLRLDESHDDSAPWQHELRLDGSRISKVSLTGGSDGGEIVVRVFRKR